MGSRNDRTFQDKLKNYFKKGSAAPLPPRQEMQVSAELERALARDAPPPRRLKLLRETADKLRETTLEMGGVEKLWRATRDLLDDPSAEMRHAELQFLCAIAEGSGSELLVMRSILFRFLRETLPDHPPEDSALRFKLLHTLTNSGKDIKCFEEQMGPFVLEWMPMIQSPSFIVEFLQLVTNVVKFNATYLDEEVVHGIVNWACWVCCWRGEAGAGRGALALLEAVVSYSLLPRAALPAFVRALARTVNLEHYCQQSWKVMRYVLGADLGYASIQEMVEILHAAGGAGDEAGAAGDDAGDAGLLRGCVFYINMALWGARRVPTLHVSYLAVLPAFAQALSSNQPVVTYEVVLAVESLARRAALELHEPAWDALLQILSIIIQQNRSWSPPNELIHTHLQSLLTTLETLSDQGQYAGSPAALLEVIDLAGHDRPEASSMRLISHTLGALQPGVGCWRAAAAKLLHKYSGRAARPAVRAHALQHLHDLVKRTRSVHTSSSSAYVNPLQGTHLLGGGGGAGVRAGAGGVRGGRGGGGAGAAARGATELALACAGDAASDLIALLEKILFRPFEMYVTESSAAVAADSDPPDVRLALAGLIEIFQRKLLGAQGAQAARALHALLELLETSYRAPRPHHPARRLEVRAPGHTARAAGDLVPRPAPAPPRPAARGTCTRSHCSSCWRPRTAPRARTTPPGGSRYVHQVTLLELLETSYRAPRPHHPARRLEVRAPGHTARAAGDLVPRPAPAPPRPAARGTCTRSHCSSCWRPRTAPRARTTPPGGSRYVHQVTLLELLEISYRAPRPHHPARRLEVRAPGHTARAAGDLVPRPAPAPPRPAARGTASMLL
ncbi:unnamed protein product [Plutella xylostella]|uniref:(diamondback moth) hypothetical protein n=1 Tax=Plutella xylostella TaxID=51655 RepID=A0A8S4D5V5_PLUXY|nr:unnamed protein product [Plutella xylostella]